MTDTITLARVYAVVKDALDYAGRPWTDKEVKAFVNRHLAREPKPENCAWAIGKVCTFSGTLGGRVIVCPGITACAITGVVL